MQSSSWQEQAQALTEAHTKTVFAVHSGKDRKVHPGLQLLWLNADIKGQVSVREKHIPALITT